MFTLVSKDEDSLADSFSLSAKHVCPSTLQTAEGRHDGGDIQSFSCDTNRSALQSSGHEACFHADFHERDKVIPQAVSHKFQSVKF